MGAVIKSKVVFMPGAFLGCLLVASVSFAAAAPGLTRSNFITFPATIPKQTQDFEIVAVEIDGMRIQNNFKEKN